MLACRSSLHVYGSVFNVTYAPGGGFRESGSYKIQPGFSEAGVLCFLLLLQARIHQERRFFFLWYLKTSRLKTQLLHETAIVESQRR